MQQVCGYGCTNPIMQIKIIIIDLILGSILTKLKTMPTKKKVYLYTLCTEGFAKGTTLNLFDFLTESHTFPDIKSKLAFYNSYLNDMQDSEPQQIKPITRIVTGK